MSARIATYIHANDPISLAGLHSQLRARPELRLVDEMAVDEADVALVVVNEFDDEAARVARALCRGDRPRIVLVAASIDESTLVAAAEAGVSGLVRRGEARADVLVGAIEKVAAGHGEVPCDLLGRLLEQVGRLQRQVLTPRGLTFAGLSPARPRSCAWSPRARTPPRLRVRCPTASARSRTSFTT